MDWIVLCPVHDTRNIFLWHLFSTAFMIFCYGFVQGPRFTLYSTGTYFVHSAFAILLYDTMSLEAMNDR